MVAFRPTHDMALTVAACVLDMLRREPEALEARDHPATLQGKGSKQGHACGRFRRTRGHATGGYGARTARHWCRARGKGREAIPARRATDTAHASRISARAARPPRIRAKYCTTQRIAALSRHPPHGIAAGEPARSHWSSQSPPVGRTPRLRHVRPARSRHTSRA
eukprot:205172-Prymnesium_polylepis.1